MPPLAKIATSNNWMQVYLALKEPILQRQFGPNEKLDIPVLAAQLGVSPTPIRDALNRLEAEGLIRTVPKVGTFVTPVTSRQVADLMETRLALECWAIDKWPELPDERKRQTVELMKDIAAQTEALLTPQTLHLYEQSDLDLQFHLALIGAGGNERMVQIYSASMNYRLFRLAKESVTLDMYRRMAAQHAAIADALAEGTPDRVKAEIRAHLDFSASNLLAYIERSGGMV